MNFRLLRAFTVLAESGHYGRTAAQLCMTQSNLSKQIVQLEDELGGCLFERGRNGARLTAFGRLCLPDALNLLRHEEEFFLRAQKASRGERGVLRIGFGISTVEIAPRLIAGFKRAHPEVEISLDDYSSQEQVCKLCNGELDFGFVRQPAGADLVFLPLLDEQLVLAVPVHSPLSSEPDDLTVLNAVGFIALNPGKGPGLAGQIAQWAAVRNFSPRITQYCDDIQTILAVVSAGLGLAIVPRQAIQLLPAKIKSIALEGPATQWRIGLAWQTEMNNPLSKRFIEYASDSIPPLT